MIDLQSSLDEIERDLLGLTGTSPGARLEIDAILRKIADFRITVISFESSLKSVSKKIQASKHIDATFYVRGPPGAALPILILKKYLSLYLRDRVTVRDTIVNKARQDSSEAHYSINNAIRLLTEVSNKNGG